MNFKLFILFFSLIINSSTEYLYATARTWKGAGVSGGTGNTDLATATNWNPNGVPSAGDVCTMNLGNSSTTLVQSTPLSVTSLTVNFNDGSLLSNNKVIINISQNFTASGAVIITNSTGTVVLGDEIDFNITAGTFTCGSFTTLASGKEPLSVLNATVSSGAILNCLGNWSSTCPAGSFTVSTITNNGTLTVSGTATISSSSTTILSMLGGNNSVTTFTGNAFLGAASSGGYTDLTGSSTSAACTFKFLGNVSLGSYFSTNAVYDVNTTWLFDGTGTQIIYDQTAFPLIVSPGNIIIGSTNNPTVSLVNSGAANIYDIKPYKNLTINGSSTLIIGINESLDNYSVLGNGTFALNGTATLNLQGIKEQFSGSSGYNNFPDFYNTNSLAAGSTVVFNASSGTQTISPNTYFGKAISPYGNVTINNTNNVSASGNIIIDNTLGFIAGNYSIGSNTTYLYGNVSYPGTGSITGSASSNLYIGGNSNSSIGILNFTTGGQILNILTINRWNGTIISNAATLGTNLTVSKLVLNYGVLSTAYNLLTIPSYPGAITFSGGVPWGTNENNFALSYIATCDAAGTPISVAGITTPLTGTYGFQINNVGAGGATGDIYFPVGATFLSAGTGVTAPTPNRMSLNNAGPADNFNVIVNYGDVGGTVNARVNRIWYINSANSTISNAPDMVTMQLFFVERATSGWPSVENEVENTPSPFDYTNIGLVEEDYSGTVPDFIAESSGSDITNFPNGTYNNQEVYALYSVGVSPDVAGNTNGIYQFNRFSITNPGGIILPVKVINFKAYQQGSGVETGWTSLNEINMDYYEVERSADASNFIGIGTVAAFDNGKPSINYGFFDNLPLQGNNYYRIKAVGKDGSITYTNIQVVVIGGGSSSINIFPNPVTNHRFVLQMTNVAAGKYALEIYNTLGQLILNQSIEHAGGSASQTIQLPSGTAHGEYHLKLIGTSGHLDKIIMLIN